MEEPGTHPIERPAPPLQFSLRSLLILQAAFALFLAMLLAARAFALIPLFLGTLTYMAVHVDPNHARWKRLIVGTLGGVVLPCLCVTYDPGILRGSGPGGDWQPFLYVHLLFQMLALSAWLLLDRRLPALGGVFSGVLYTGAITAMLIGLPMLFISLLGLLFVIGVLGLVPWLTCYVFAVNAAEAFRRARNAIGATMASYGVLVGITVAIVIPLAVNAVFGTMLEQAIEAVNWPGPFPEALFPF